MTCIIHKAEVGLGRLALRYHIKVPYVSRVPYILGWLLHIESVDKTLLVGPFLFPNKVLSDR